MKNTNDDRYLKKNGKTVKKNYVARKNSLKKDTDKKLFSKGFVFLLIILALATITICAYFHPYMQISDIYVTGNNTISDSEIIGYLSNPIGKNILFYKVNDSEENLKKLDKIDDVEIKKVFPNILSVKVDENYPLFYQENENEIFFISNKCKVLKADIKDYDQSLIKISGAKIKKTIGQNFTSSKATIDFINEIQKYPYFKDLKELNLENKTDIGIMLRDIDVNFGDLNNINFKLKLLDHILSEIKNKDIKVSSIDLNNGKNPIVKVYSKSFNENLNK